MKRHHDDEQERERKTRKAGRQGDVQITVVAVSREIGPEVGHFSQEDVRCPPERHEPVTGERTLHGVIDREAPHIGSPGEGCIRENRIQDVAGRGAIAGDDDDPYQHQQRAQADHHLHA